MSSLVQTWASFDALLSKVQPALDPCIGKVFDPWVLVEQPEDDIRDYFGDHVAIYFAWLGMYTSSLLPCAILGVMSQMVNFANPDKGIDGNATTLAFSVFLGLWSTVFLELWHRREFELRCLWGSEGFEQKEQPRLQFIGVSHCTITVGCVLRKPSESRYEF